MPALSPACGRRWVQFQSYSTWGEGKRKAATYHSLCHFCTFRGKGQSIIQQSYLTADPSFRQRAGNKKEVHRWAFTFTRTAQNSHPSAESKQQESFLPRLLFGSCIYRCGDLILSCTFEGKRQTSKSATPSRKQSTIGFSSLLPAFSMLSWFWQPQPRAAQDNQALDLQPVPTW